MKMFLLFCLTKYRKVTEESNNAIKQLHSFHPDLNVCWDTPVKWKWKIVRDTANTTSVEYQAALPYTLLVSDVYTWNKIRVLHYA